MTKNEIIKFLKRIEAKQIDLSKNNCTFNAILLDESGDFHHAAVGMGDKLIITEAVSLIHLYDKIFEEKPSIEDFADSVRQLIVDIYYYNESGCTEKQRRKNRCT